MPISYQFKDTSGNPVLLDTIDREVCDDFGTPYSTTHYSHAMIMITYVGDYAVRSGNFKMEDFEGAIQKCGYDDEKRWKMLKYIYGKYFYHSWR